MEATRDAVQDLAAQTGVPIAPHISCMAQSEKMLRDILTAYRLMGVNRLVVLRGDRPEGMAFFDFVVGDIHGIRVHELRQHAKEGGKLVGTYCVFVPEELCWAVPWERPLWPEISR